jgi:hypothetical protein
MVYNKTSKIIYGKEKNVWLQSFCTDSKKYISMYLTSFALQDQG